MVTGEVVGAMSETNKCGSVAFNPVYSTRFRRQVKKGKANPLTGVKIRADDEYILGSEDTVSSTYLAGTFQEALEMIEDIEKGETGILEFADGPTYLVLEPSDEEHVTLTGCLTYESAHNPDRRRASERRVIVPKHAWINELLRATREFLQKAREVNPELRNSDRFEELNQTIETVDRKYC